MKKWCSGLGTETEKGFQNELSYIWKEKRSCQWCLCNATATLLPSLHATNSGVKMKKKRNNNDYVNSFSQKNK